MTLDKAIREQAEAGTLAALEQHLPQLLAAFTQPADPDRLYTIQETAERCSVPVSTIRARIDKGDLWTVPMGKHVRIPQRAITEFIEAQRLRQKFKRDQNTGGAEADLDAELARALNPTRRPI